MEKRKQSIGEGSGKRSSKAPAAYPPLRPVAYAAMPKNHKKKFYINDDVGGGLMKYIEVIQWLRVMGSFDGVVFEDLPNLNWSGEGFPLVEIEVITPQLKSAKFIIAKSSLYLIACCVRLLQFQFKCEFVIDGFTMLQAYDGSYTTEPWKTLGPQSMTESIDLLSDITADLSDIDMSLYVGACEVFYVHLCEAARLYVVELLICKTLEPTTSVDVFENPTYEDEEKCILTSNGGEVIPNDEDVYCLVKVNAPINLNHTVLTPDYIECFIKKYKLMSKIWFTYSLTERRHFEMKPADVSILHMRSIKSLRCTLAVLCNTNLDKILKEWEKKSKNHATVTRVVYEKMVKQVRELQKHNKVLLHNIGDDS